MHNFLIYWSQWSILLVPKFPENKPHLTIGKIQFDYACKKRICLDYLLVLVSTLEWKHTAENTERFRQFTWNGQILTFFKFHLGSCTIYQTLAKSLRVTDLKEFWARRGHTTPKIKVKVTHLQIFNFCLCIDLYCFTCILMVLNIEVSTVFDQRSSKLH